MIIDFAQKMTKSSNHCHCQNLVLMHPLCSIVLARTGHIGDPSNDQTRFSDPSAVANLPEPLCDMNGMGDLRNIAQRLKVRHLSSQQNSGRQFSAVT